MKWYYVEDGQQTGPVEEGQLEEMARNGAIAPNTLVWHEGMENWAPYGSVKGGADAPAPQPAAGLRLARSAPVAATSAATAEAVCTECGRIFPVDNMIRHGAAHVCANCKPIFMQRLAEGAPIRTGELNYAGFWIRFGAKLVDGLIIGIVLLAPLFFIVFRSAFSGGEPNLVAVRVAQVGYYLAAALYSIFFVGKYGATPGKMMCKLQIVTADGLKVGYGRATGRYFAEILSGITCNIGYIIAAFDGQKRALHDHICSTRVVHKS